MKQAAAKKPTTGEEVGPIAQFGYALFDIGWQLAITVVGSLWLGSYLDARLGTKPWFSGIAFLFAIVSFGLIVYRVVQKLPKAYGGKR